MKKIVYYLKLYKAFVKNTFARETDYRANFIADLIDSLFNFLVSIIFFESLYLNVDSIAGWSKWQSLLLVGTSQLITAVIYTLFMNNLPRIQTYILRGNFDYITLKPCDEQFYVSFRYFYFGGIASVMLAIVLIGYSLTMLQIPINIIKMLVYAMFVVSGICICYSIWFIIMTTSIVFLKVGELHELFLSMLKFMEYPGDIYKNASRYIFLYVIPLATIANVPVKYILSKVTLINSVYTFLIALIFLVLSRVFWKKSLRWYQSASS